MATKITKEKITPARAKAILAASENAYDKNKFKNRNVNKRNVARLAKVMKDKHFHGLASEPIALTDDKELINGQHRLLAVIESGLEQTMIVARGVDRDAYKYLDNVGKVRTNADILKINGYLYYTAKAAAFKIVDKYDNGRAASIGGSTDLIGYEVIEQIEAYGDEYLDDFCRDAARIVDTTDFSNAIVLAGMILAFKDKKDEEKIRREWVDGLTEKIPTLRGDPRCELRRYGRSSKRKERGSSSATFAKDFRVYAMCWNKFLDGSTVSQNLVTKTEKSEKIITINPVTSYLPRDDD